MSLKFCVKGTKDAGVGSFLNIWELELCFENKLEKITKKISFVLNLIKNYKGFEENLKNFKDKKNTQNIETQSEESKFNEIKTLIYNLEDKSIKNLN